MQTRITGASSESDATRFESAAVSLEITNSVASQGPSKTIAVTGHRPNSDKPPVYKVVAFGREDVFKSEDLTPYGYNNDDIWLWNWQGFLDGEENSDYIYLTAVSGYYDDTPAQGTDTEWHAVIGLETDLGKLPMSSTASYEGGTNLVFYVPDDGRTLVRSELEITADFGTNKISGKMDSFETRLLGDESYDDLEAELAIIIRETDILGNGFSAALAFDADNCDHELCSGDLTDKSSFAGGFYGDAAQEAGGTLYMDLGEGIGPGAGVWYANQ